MPRFVFIKEIYMEKKKKKSYISIFFTAFLIFGINFLIFQPPIRRWGHGPNYRMSCYSNIRVIQEAVELYNMDHKEMMTDLDMKLLIDSHYLKNEPRKPEKDCNYYSSDDLTKYGEVCCDVHGGLITKANSEIARKREIEQQKYEREKRLKELNEKLFLNIMRVLPTIIYLLFALMS